MSSSAIRKIAFVFVYPYFNRLTLRCRSLGYFSSSPFGHTRFSYLISMSLDIFNKLLSYPCINTSINCNRMALNSSGHKKEGEIYIFGLLMNFTRFNSFSKHKKALWMQALYRNKLITQCKLQKKKKTAKANNTIFDMDWQNKIIIRCVVIYRLFFIFGKTMTLNVAKFCFCLNKQSIFMHC